MEVALPLIHVPVLMAMLVLTVNILCVVELIAQLLTYAPIKVYVHRQIIANVMTAILVTCVNTPCAQNEIAQIQKCVLVMEDVTIQISAFAI